MTELWFEPSQPFNRYAVLPLMKNTNIYPGRKVGAPKGFERADPIWIVWVQGQPGVVCEGEDP